MKQRNSITIIMLFVLLFSSCIKDIEDTNVPKVILNPSIRLDLRLPECTPLHNTGAAIALEDVSSYYTNAGFNGIMVIQSVPGTYYAYDQCCTNNLEERHRLKPNGALAECPVCESVFILDILGSLVSGPAPAKYNLRKYNVQRVGNYLTISN